MSACRQTPSHEYGLLFRNLHVDTPELVEQVLVSRHQIGKCLRQHPRGRRYYHIHHKCHEWKWVMSRDGKTYCIHFHPLSMR